MKKALESRALAGENLEDEEREPTFQDWARFVTIQPALYFRPQDMDDLNRFMGGIQQGIFKQKSLRVLGGLHSCSDICVSDAILDVSDLARTIEFAPDNSSVTATANWHLHDFLLALSQRGKSLGATGGTDHQTLAGLISTNTAPATAQHALYDLLEWVEYITIDEASGGVIEKRVGRSEPAFGAVVCSLGAIGILTRVHFRLVDEPYFETIQKIEPLNNILANLASTAQKYEFWRIDWIPDTDQGLLWAARRVSHADPNGDYADDQSENILVAIFRVLDKLEGAGPLLDDAMRLVYAGLALTYGETKVSGPLRTMLPVDRRAPLHVAMAEWSFNPSDLARLLQACRDYYHKNGWPNLPIEIELTKTDNYFMSAWNWPGLDYIVKFNFMYLTDISESGPKHNEINAHLKGLWDYLIQAGIPFKAHWGKINFMDYDFVQKNYQIDAFKPFIRGMFVNDYLAERIMPK
jgi:FAD/FMN-containing dehydrogenase